MTLYLLVAGRNLFAMNRSILSLLALIMAFSSFSQFLPKFHLTFGADQLIYRSHYPMGDYLEEQGSIFHYYGLNTSLNKSIYTTFHSSLQIGLQFDFRKLVIEDAQYQYATYIGDVYTLVPFVDKGDLRRKNFDWNLVFSYLHSFKKESLRNFFLNASISTNVFSIYKSGIFTSDQGVDILLFDFNKYQGSDLLPSFDTDLNFDINYWLKVRKNRTPLCLYVGGKFNLYSNYGVYNNSFHAYGGIRLNFSELKEE